LHSIGIEDFHSSKNPFIHLSVSTLIAGDEPIADADDAVGVFGDVFFVRDQNDGVALHPKLFEQGHHFFAGFGIEISGRLVGEEDGGAINEGAGDRDALALAAGGFVRAVMNAGAETRGGEGVEGKLAALIGGHAGIDHRQRDMA